MSWLYIFLKGDKIIKSLIFIFILLFSLLNATIINVPADQPTIQAGINSAANTDTVLVQPGTYVENITYDGKLITVGSLFLTTQDSTYISTTIIDGDSSGSVVTFNNGEDSTAVLCSFTITNGGSMIDGAGIFCENSSPTLKNLVITGNNFDSLDQMQNRLYLGSGGGIYFNNSYSMLSNLTITDNTAQYGAGIYCIDSELELSNVFIIGNNLVGGGFTFSGSGGGIASYG